jgi:hypothetical protein
MRPDAIDRPDARPTWALCAAFALTLTFGSLSSVSAAPQAALDSGPPGAAMTFYVRDMDAVVAWIDDVRALLRYVGLGDEGFAWVSEQSKAELGFDALDRKSLAAAGYDLSRGVALFVQGPRDDAWSLVVGVADEKAFLATTEKAIAKMADKKVKTKKASEAGGTSYTLSPGNEEPLHVYVKDGLAWMGLGDGVRYAKGGQAGSAPSPFPPTGAKLDMGAHFDVEALARESGDADLADLATFARSGWFRVLQQEGRFSTEGRLEAAEASRDILAKLVPRYVDAPRQTAVLRSLRADPSVIFRMLWPVQGMHQLLEENGLLDPQELESIRKDTGVDLVEDVFKVFLGDMTFVAPTGVADLRLEMTVSDSDRAEKVVRAMFDALADELRVETAALPNQPGAYRTTLRDEGPEEWIAGKLYWTVREGRLVFGLTADSVAIPSYAGETFTGTEHGAIAKGQLEDPSFVFLYVRGDDALSGMHGVLAVARELLGTDALPFTDLLDVPLLMGDIYLHTAMAFDLDADGASFVGETSYLPLTPDPAPGSAMSAFGESLKTLYAGHVESARRAWLALREAHRGTPYGLRAERNLVSESSMMTLYALLTPTLAAGAASRWMMGGAAAPYSPDEAYPTEPYVDDAVEATPAAPVDPLDPCLAWAENACYYKGAESDECKKANRTLAGTKKKFSKKEQQKCALDLYEMRGW